MCWADKRMREENEPGGCRWGAEWPGAERRPCTPWLVSCCRGDTWAWVRGVHRTRAPCRGSTSCRWNVPNMRRPRRQQHQLQQRSMRNTHSDSIINTEQIINTESIINTEQIANLRQVWSQMKSMSTSIKLYSSKTKCNSMCIISLIFIFNYKYVNCENGILCNREHSYCPVHKYCYLALFCHNDRNILDWPSIRSAFLYQKILVEADSNIHKE